MSCDLVPVYQLPTQPAIARIRGRTDLEPIRDERFRIGYPAAVRRYLLAFLVLALVGGASAAAYSAYATEREYARLIGIGDRSAAGEQPFEALEAYSGAVALRPDSMIAYLKRGRMYHDRGEPDAAARDLRRAVELDPTATLPLELLGDTYLTLRRHDRAAARYQAYLSLDDRSPRVWYKLGLALYRDGYHASAVAPLHRAIALESGLAEAHLLLGLCLREQGDAVRARAALEAASRLSPALTAPREALVEIYQESGEMSRSIDQLEALAALDAASPRRFVALGTAHARARRHEAAVLTLSRAVERFPSDPEVYGALGRVWLDAATTRHDPIALRKAIEALQTAAAHPEVSSDTLTSLGRATLMAGNAVAAERALLRAVSKRPVAPEAYRRLSTLMAGTARVQEARAALVTYVTLISDTAPVAAFATEIATYSVQLADADAALHWIDRAVDEAGETATLTALRQRALAIR